MNFMQKKLVVIVLMIVFVVMGVAFGKTKIVDSKFTGKPPVLDGLTADWDIAAFNKESSCEVTYAFQNTPNNLYLVFSFTDPKYISTFGATGLVIWFDAKNTQKKDLGLRFRKMRLTPDQFITLWEKQNGALADDKKARLKEQPFYVIDRIERLEKGKEIPLPLQAPTEGTPQFQINGTKTQTTLEFRIPFSQIPEFSFAAANHLTVGFEWGGVPAKSKNSYFDLEERLETYDRQDESADDLKSTKDGDDMSVGASRDHFRRPPAKYSFWVEINLAKQ